MRDFISTAAAFALAVLAGQAPAQIAQTEALGVAESEEFGRHLVAAGGHPVYFMLTEQSAGDDLPPLESCHRECLVEWPVLIVEGEASFGEGVDRSLAETRDWMGQQVQFYAHRPLFLFYRDVPGAEPMGQGIFSFGGYWALVTPSGDPIRTDAMPEPTQD